MSDPTLKEMLEGITPKVEETPKAKEEKVEEEKKEEAPPPAPEEEKKEVPEEKMVSLSALQEERMKRRQMKKELDEMKVEIQKLRSGSSYDSSESSEQASSNILTRKEFLERELHKSVHAVRRTAKDATEMFEIWDKAVDENPELYNKMMESPDPGTFAYEYGKSIKNQEVYGDTPEEAYKRGMAAAEKATKEKVFKDLKQKKAIGDALPKNISEGGTSGSGGEAAPWQSPDAKQFWG